MLPLRQLDLLCPLPSGVDPPPRLGVFPWQFDAVSIASACPARRSWGQGWVLLQELNETLALDDFVELLCGAAAPVEVAACWLELAGDQPWFRLRQGLIEARRLDDVRHLRRERRQKSLQQQRERQWQELLRRRQPLQLEQLPADQQQRLAQLQSLARGEQELEQLDPALRRSLESLHLATDRGDLRHLLADLGQWDRHRLMALEGTTWSSGFSAELEAEAGRLEGLSGDTWPSDAERVDLCHQHCVTIDDDDTRDIDDGLALERLADGGRRIWIHVADPGRLVAADTPLDREARRRGSSLYLAGGILPMFPAVLSNGPFSLRQGIRSAAWSFWVELDADGDIATTGLCRSWVRPTYRLSYGDADELIDLAPPEDPDLAELEALLDRRRRWRQNRGALLMDLPEGRIRSRDGEPVLEITEPSPSRQLVAEAMILAGSLAARFGMAHGLALPYRSQLPAELPPAAELQALPDGPVRFAAIKRCLSRGLMGSEPAPHFSLGLPAYVQATSPIRRYGDLVVQRQLAAQLEGLQPLAAEALQQLLEAFDGAVREGIAISREDQRHWQQVWFEAHRSGQWRGAFLRWLRPQDRLGLVRLEDLALDLAVECPAGSKPGVALLVRVKQVDSLRDQLRLVAAAS